MKIESADQARAAYRKAKRMSLEQLAEAFADWPDDIPEASGRPVPEVDAERAAFYGGIAAKRELFTLEKVRARFLKKSPARRA